MVASHADVQEITLKARSLQNRVLDTISKGLNVLFQYIHTVFEYYTMY